MRFREFPFRSALQQANIRAVFLPDPIRVDRGMEFCSAEYMAELMRRVNADKAFNDLRKTGRDATYSLHIEPEPENGVAGPFTVGFSVIGGKMDEVWTGHDKTSRLTDLVISGKYGVWVDIIQNRLKLTDALFTRKLTLRGETDQIYGPTVWMSPGPLFGVGITAATERIIEIARQIPTEFHGKYVTSKK